MPMAASDGDAAQRGRYGPNSGASASRFRRPATAGAGKQPVAGGQQSPARGSHARDRKHPWAAPTPASATPADGRSTRERRARGGNVITLDRWHGRGTSIPRRVMNQANWSPSTRPSRPTLDRRPICRRSLAATKFFLARGSFSMSEELSHSLLRPTLKKVTVGSEDSTKPLLSLPLRDTGDHLQD